MAEIKNDRYLKALAGHATDKTPVWIMRQAGRYLPEYRETRRQAGSFMTLCQTPELAAEVTLQPLRRFDLDAAIVFSDILTVPDAMGLGLEVLEGKGPVFASPVRTGSEIEALPAIAPMESLQYVFDAISTLKQSPELTIPLIGFSGSPWTLVTYMVEGQGSKDFRLVKALAFREPSLMQTLLRKVTDSVVAYLAAQIEAGADALMIFDTWGGILSSSDFESLSLAPISEIVTALKSQSPNTPITVFTKGGGQWLSSIAATGCDCVGLDWTINPLAARAMVGDSIALQGNLDPAVLLAGPNEITRRATETLRAFGDNPRHIFNLGHGITPDVPPENLAALIECVHAFKK